MGSFSHPALLGTFGAGLAAMYVGLAAARGQRAVGAVGLLMCFTIVLLANSGGPLTMLVVVGIGWTCWLIRRQMLWFRLAILGAVVLLVFAMRDPIWYLPSKMSLLFGGGGWHRSYLMDQAIRHIGQWWLVGMPLDQTANWFPYQILGAADMTNSYVGFGVDGGLVAMLLLIWMLVRAFGEVGRASYAFRESVPSQIDEELLTWGFGAAIAGHMVNLLSISYFDQTTGFWLFQLAALSGIAAALHSSPRIHSRPASTATSLGVMSVAGQSLRRKPPSAIRLTFWAASVMSMASEHRSDLLERRPLLVWHAGVSWNSVAGTDRHMVSALRRYADVLWVDPPISPLSPARFKGSHTRRPWPDLRSLAESVWRLTPKVLPFHSRVYIHATTSPLVNAQTRWALKMLRRTPFAVVATHFDDVLRSSEQGVLRVLYGTDDYVAGAQLMDVSRGRIEREEMAQLARADIAFCVSEELAARWKSRGLSRPITVLPNGVDVTAYHSARSGQTVAAVALPPPIAGLVGRLSSRIDINLLDAVVEEGCSLLMVGPYDPNWEPSRFARLLAHPRVKWVGEVSFESLPKYLQPMDVGLTPYVDSEFNRASFPLKTLEYLAAGKPVVSTDLPSTRRLSTDLVTIADSARFGIEARIAASASRSMEMERSSGQLRGDALVGAKGGGICSCAWFEGDYGKNFRIGSVM